MDCFETFAPTPVAASVKIAEAVVNKKDWLLKNLDIKQVYMRLPTCCGHMSGEVVPLHVHCMDSNRLVDNRGFCGLEGCTCRKLAWNRVRLT